MPIGFKPIRLEVESGVATLTLHRPEKRNPINDVMREGLSTAPDVIVADRGFGCLSSPTAAEVSVLGETCCG